MCTTIIRTRIACEHGAWDIEGTGGCTEDGTAMVTRLITREGTNYGFYEYTVKEQLAKAKLMLEQGKISIVFDTVIERCHIINERQLAELQTLVSEC